jgi:hypothetical protein
MALLEQPAGPFALACCLQLGITVVFQFDADSNAIILLISELVGW